MPVTCADVFEYARVEMHKSFPSVSSGPYSLTRDPECSWEPTCQLRVKGWYTRCDSDKWMHLLTTLPLINPGRRRIYPGGMKDYPTPFYLAQCLHYGLPRQKTKTGAKKALLAYAEANDGKLVVPLEVQQIEDDLRKKMEPLEEHWRLAIKDIDRIEKDFNNLQLRKRKRQDGEIIRTVAKEEQVYTESHHLSTGATFKVVAPDITAQWDSPDDGMVLRLCRSASGSHVWGEFEFGIFEGVLRSEQIHDPSSSIFSFHWRDQESGTGEDTHSTASIGELQFLDDTCFRGKMYWDGFGTFSLIGTMDWEQKGSLRREMGLWKDAYRDLNVADDYFNEAQVKRDRPTWGKRKSPVDPEDSDTTACGSSEDEDEDDDQDDGLEDDVLDEYGLLEDDGDIELAEDEEIGPSPYVIVVGGFV